MNEFIKKLMTEEEFNSVCIVDREAIEKEANFAEDMLSWPLVIRNHNLTEDTLRKFVDRLDWYRVSQYKNLTLEFINEFKDKLDWDELSRYHVFSEDQLIWYVDRIDWDLAPTFQPNVNEKVIEAVLNSSKKDELNWHGALCKVKFSEQFLKKYCDDIVKANKWEIVSYYQKLSEDFMEKFADTLNWNYLSQKQVMSRDFMIKHFDKINTAWAKKFQKNWDDNIEKDVEAYKILCNTDHKTIEQNFMSELKNLMEKYGYEMNTLKQLIINN